VEHCGIQRGHVRVSDDHVCEINDFLAGFAQFLSVFEVDVFAHNELDCVQCTPMTLELIALASDGDGQVKSVGE
jgi:hypothetical protein